jgi:hypothetical protein
VTRAVPSDRLAISAVLGNRLAVSAGPSDRLAISAVLGDRLAVRAGARP